MAIPNVRKIFASFRTVEEESYFARLALYNFLGFLGSIVLFNQILRRLPAAQNARMTRLGIPGKEIRHRLTDAQWQDALAVWAVSLAPDSPLPLQDKADFVLAYFTAAALESRDTLADDSRKVGADGKLAAAVTSTTLALPVDRLLHGDILVELAAFSRNLLVELARRYETDFLQHIKTRYLASLGTNSQLHDNSSTSDSPSLQQALENIALLAQSPALGAILAEAALADAFVQLLNTKRLNFAERKALLRASLDVLRSPGQSLLQRGLRSGLQEHSSPVLMDNCRGLMSLSEFVIERSPAVVETGQMLTELWTIGSTSRIVTNKGKGRAVDEPEDASRAKTASLVSEIQSLLPDLDDDFVERCLQHYGGNAEDTLAHLLDNDVPDHLRFIDKSAEPSAQLDASPAKVWSDHSASLPERRNIYDDDEFDRLEHDKSRVLQRGDRNAAHRLDTAAGDADIKKKVLSLAFDPDDDELDDTYDEVDAIGIPDQQLVDELGIDSAASRGDMVEQTLLLALEVDSTVFARQNRKTAARAQLRGQTNMSDEQIEGWKSMLDRQPKRLQALMSKYEFSGEQEQVNGSKWQPDGQESGTTPSGTDHSRGRGGSSRGNAGRGRGHPRGRGGQTAQPSASRRPIDPERRNRRNLREKKLARGVND